MRLDQLFDVGDYFSAPSRAATTRGAHAINAVYDIFRAPAPQVVRRSHYFQIILETLSRWGEFNVLFSTIRASGLANAPPIRRIHGVALVAIPVGLRVARKQPFNLDRAHAVEIIRNRALSDHEAKTFYLGRRGSFSRRGLSCMFFEHRIVSLRSPAAD
ncbi:MAG: hypothetical protein ACR65U_05870 [Methylocystis sp.]